MSFTVVDFILANLVVFLGSILQASTGMASGIVVAPLIAFINIHFIPGPIIFSSTVLTFSMAVRERKYIYFHHLGKLIFGFSVGAIFGALFITNFHFKNLGAIYGLMILMAIILSFKGMRISINAYSAFLVGIISAFMGITATVGGVVVALFYQNLSGKQIRATLGFSYFIAALIMMSVLIYFGRFNFSHVLAGCYLLPGMILGFVLSSKITRFVDRGYAKIIILSLSLIFSIALIIKSLLL